MGKLGEVEREPHQSQSSTVIANKILNVRIKIFNTQKVIFSALVLLVIVMVMSQSNYKLITMVIPLKKQNSLSNGRQANDGGWYVLSTPFPINLYSAFYDNRTSLGTDTPQIVLVGQFDSQSIDRCLLWFAVNYEANNTVIVPAQIVGVAKHDKLLICIPPANILNGRIPIEVAPAWTDKSAASGFSWTTFRIPVTVPRWRPSRGRLALCLTAMVGSGWQPKHVVEWLEMQRLLGVERVIVYNRSMPYQLRRVFDEYSHDGDNDQRNFVVELRQSHGSLPHFNEGYSHQTPILNDCYYRNMGSYQYIAIIDVDELIVPRKNFTTLPELIDHLNADRNSTIGSFVFRNLHYFFNESPNDTAEEEVHRLLPVSHHNRSSLSMYLTKTRRAAVVSPLDFSVKSVINSDACIGVWVHFCMAFTAEFAKQSDHMFKVDPELAVKHHNRVSCNFDRWLAYFKMDNCQKASQTSIFDDILLFKYGKQLVDRLIKQYDVLQIT